MAHYAKVENDIVTQVIVAEKDFFNTFVDSSPGEWIQTSYNKSIRKNFAGIGFTYDLTLDAFIPPQPYASWTLNEDTCLWDSPIACPDDGEMLDWNEETLTWENN